MRYVGAFTPQSVPTGSFDLTARKGKFVFSDESCNNLVVTFSNGFTRKIPAGIASLVCLDVPGTLITYTTISTLNIPCIDACDIDFYETYETLPETYPSSLVRQTIVGNSLNLATSTTSIVNDGNNPLTQIIEAKPNDALTSTWQADNSGNLTISGDNGGTLTTLLQLVAGVTPAVKLFASGLTTEVLGNVQIDGLVQTVNGSVSGTVKFYAPIWGDALKIGILLYNNYRDASVRAFNFPSTLNNGVFFTGNWANGTDTETYFHLSVAQSSRVLTALASTGGTVAAVTNIHQLSVGFTPTADQIQISTISNARSTVDLFIGA